MPRGGFNAGREELAQPWGCRGAMNSGFEQSVCVFVPKQPVIGRRMNDFLSPQESSLFVCVWVCVCLPTPASDQVCFPPLGA